MGLPGAQSASGRAWFVGDLAKAFVFIFRPGDVASDLVQIARSFAPQFRAAPPSQRAYIAVALGGAIERRKPSWTVPLVRSSLPFGQM